MKKILLLDTSIATLNQGDEIINISIRNNWKNLFKDNYIMTMATHTPTYTMLQSYIYKNKLGIFKDADFKFLCGTNALYTNMLRPLPSWNINVLNCGLVSRTICLGVGIGVNSEKCNYYTRHLYNKVLNHNYIHSVRDEKTREFLIKLGFKAENTGCPTLWGLTPQHCSEIPSTKGKRVVFTLTYYEKDILNDKAMIDVLVKNYSEVYFWPQSIKDLEYFDELDIKDEIKIIPPNVAQYADILSMDGTDYVGNRLHGGIFAMQKKCRTIIISIDYRAENMSSNYSFVCIDRKNINSQLNEMINSGFKTKISGIDFEKIDAWKRQFI